jgi:hypothetical protein
MYHKTLLILAFTTCLCSLGNKNAWAIFGERLEGSRQRYGKNYDVVYDPEWEPVSVDQEGVYTETKAIVWRRKGQSKGYTIIQTFRRTHRYYSSIGKRAYSKNWSCVYFQTREPCEGTDAAIHEYVDQRIEGGIAGWIKGEGKLDASGEKVLSWHKEGPDKQGLWDDKGAHKIVPVKRQIAFLSSAEDGDPALFIYQSEFENSWSDHIRRRQEAIARKEKSRPQVATKKPVNQPEKNEPSNKNKKAATGIAGMARKEVTLKAIDMVGERYEGMKVKVLNIESGRCSKTWISELPYATDKDGNVFVNAKKRWVGFSASQNDHYFQFLYTNIPGYAPDGVIDTLIELDPGDRINVAGRVVALHNMGHGLDVTDIEVIE